MDEEASSYTQSNSAPQQQGAYQPLFGNASTSSTGAKDYASDYFATFQSGESEGLAQRRFKILERSRGLAPKVNQSSGACEPLPANVHERVLETAEEALQIKKGEKLKKMIGYQQLKEEQKTLALLSHSISHQMEEKLLEFERSKPLCATQQSLGYVTREDYQAQRAPVYFKNEFVGSLPTWN